MGQTGLVGQRGTEAVSFNGRCTARRTDALHEPATLVLSSALMGDATSRPPAELRTRTGRNGDLGPDGWARLSLPGLLTDPPLLARLDGSAAEGAGSSSVESEPEEARAGGNSPPRDPPEPLGASAAEAEARDG